MSVPSDATHSRRSLFIVLEGVDGSGKTTQAQLLTAWLQEQGIPVVLTREPGGSVLGERLRTLILDHTLPCTPRAELLLFMAARAQHMAEVISPALAAGTVVICDRFALSTLVYQGFVRGLPLDEIRAANEVATGGIHPDLTVLIDVPYEVVYARIGERQDRFEGEGGQLLRKVIEGYRHLAVDTPAVRIIDGTGAVESVQDALRRMVADVQSNRA